MSAERFIWLIVLAVLACPVPAFGAAQTSPNYRLDSQALIPSDVDAASPNYSVKGTVEPIVGPAESPTFFVRQGAQRPDDVTAMEAGGGGASVILAAEPGSAFVPVCGVFASPYLLFGERNQNSDAVSVNDDTARVELPTATTWQSWRTLALGDNRFAIRVHNTYGWSEITYAAVYRRALGDTNADRLIDDADLSFLAAYFFSNRCEADFNADGIVDDADLSLIASQWSV